MEIFKSHQSELLSPVLPRLLFMALQFAQAFLVRRATQYIELPVEVNTYKNGGGLIAAYILVYLGIAVIIPLARSTAMMRPMYLQVAGDKQRLSAACGPRHDEHSCRPCITDISTISGTRHRFRH